MPEKVIIHNSRYDLIERKGKLFIIPQPAKSKTYALQSVFTVTFTTVVLICLLLFPPVSIFLLLSLLLTNGLKKGLNG